MVGRNNVLCHSSAGRFHIAGECAQEVHTLTHSELMFREQAAMDSIGREHKYIIARRSRLQQLKCVFAHVAQCTRVLNYSNQIVFESICTEIVLSQSFSSSYVFDHYKQFPLHKVT